MAASNYTGTTRTSVYRSTAAAWDTLVTHKITGYLLRPKLAYEHWLQKLGSGR